MARKPGAGGRKAGARRGRPGRGPRRRPNLLPLLALVAVLGVASWWALSREAPPAGEGLPAAGGRPSAEPAVGEPRVERLGVEVLAAYPHDPQAYTQGLIWDGGTVIESTGRNGASSLRRWQLEDGRILRRVDLPAELFGEGVARVGERLIQLTWRAGRALVYDAGTFEKVGELVYQGEGWGLCFDGRRLVMSDGSASLTFRDPVTLAEMGRLPVTLEGRPLRLLNELECVGDAIYANIYTTDSIARIDPAHGRVTALIDASGLLTREERLGAEVLNGIAFRPETDTFLLTGKLWPKVFEVRFVD